MTTLDIFANNIIGGSKAVQNLSGENANRWIKIKSANFFIVNKLNQADSQSVSSTIDSNGKLTFDQNGNIQSPVYVTNPLAPNMTDALESDDKQFLKKDNPGYSKSRDIIFSSNLKWILYRDKSDANQMYILYNPMHRQNVKNYHAQKATGGNAYGDNLMQKLIQQYRDTFTISSLNDGNKSVAIFAEPTCACYDLRNCTNDFAKFYVSQEASDKIGWSCACTSPSCTLFKQKGREMDDSFLQNFREFQKTGVDCSTNLSICSVDFVAAGNITAKDVNIQQNCDLNKSTAPTDSPQTEAPTEAPDLFPTLAPTQPPSKLSAPLMIGGGVALLVILAFIVFMVMKAQK
jgi:hypothetical protein